MLYCSCKSVVIVVQHVMRRVRLAAATALHQHVMRAVRVGSPMDLAFSARPVKVRCCLSSLPIAVQS